MTSKESRDWHRADVVAELKKRGLTLAELGRQNGLSPSTVKNALDKHYVNGEEIIASALNMKPEQIWPSRYAKQEHFQPRECA
ncbi:TPA: transcriptional regulator [Vibrio parahaemolyticus]|uniref:helix-turn-helix domain-containing protein n=1 Tax=Vibrio parahaemolyticus TaxID=670 RepID=UPI002052E793|nr:helix-turn-helix transcriptional regulator [Vibrio parahaemolyticus]UPR17254.1 helix-turn-helix domain-containing protein [Vibrio parahaemolyticus]UPR23237.1 helix-turn-helix domain-containing protein [Vibrio parahaemolyticus]HAV1517151.1 transcriptional regulator [Vibrio parahaemolyticus]HAV1521789.1 transcriptional regulator [Vibrio parahaemolyticus]HAV1536115.1 transcriptional regulator [Vibrio parahaemolyticus]